MNMTASMAQLRRSQQILAWLAALNLTSILYPPQYLPTDRQQFDFIIVGGGTAGCVLANRLTERPDFRVLLVEAGSDPPIEVDLPGLYSLTPQTHLDWNFTSAEDQLTARRHRKHVLELTRGHVLGGSSAINLMLHVRGAAYDYRAWAAAARNATWDWPSLLRYFVRSERLLDARLLQDPYYGPAHGARGPVAITRQEDRAAEPFLRAFSELGHRLVPDINAGDSLSYTQPMFNLAAGRRSHSAFAYLTPIKNRKNLFVFRGALVTKILINEHKFAFGIACETFNKRKLQLFAKREVILSAGALQTPQLLMLSGIGPVDHLLPLNIPVVADLPVGENLQDHTAILLVHQLPKALLPPAPPSTRFPATIVLGFVALNKSQEYADYQSVSFLIPQGSMAGLQSCVFQFGFDAEICQPLWNAAPETATLMTTHHLLHPRSRGLLRLRSANPRDAPLVYLGIYSDDYDLDRAALYLADFARIVNTSYFRSVGASDLELGNCATRHKRGSNAYWRCYALELTTTSWHYSGTCALGRVVDARLRVHGVHNLRVADASIMPTVSGGNTNAPTLTIAELASDLIKLDHKY